MNVTSSWLSTTCALFLLAAACSQPAASTPASLPGYIHVFGRSRFDLGGLVREVDEFGMHKVIGTDGTFATQLVSKAAVGVHNVPFPDPSTGVSRVMPTRRTQR
ncbi:MAG TPA: hypothetical protein VIU64_14435 [Polyangia bacterium]